MNIPGKGFWSQDKFQRVVVGVSDMYMSDSCLDRIITFSLGSCLGVTVYDEKLKIGGMLHCMLPSARMDMDKAEEHPEMFVDSGLSLMIQHLFNCGATRGSLIVKMAGCASVLNDNEFFRVGERNYACAKKFFEKNLIKIAAEDVLGTSSRTMTLYMDCGITTIRISNKEVVL